MNESRALGGLTTTLLLLCFLALLPVSFAKGFEIQVNIEKTLTKEGCDAVSATYYICYSTFFEFFTINDQLPNAYHFLLKRGGDLVIDETVVPPVAFTGNKLSIGLTTEPVNLRCAYQGMDFLELLQPTNLLIQGTELNRLTISNCRYGVFVQNDAGDAKVTLENLDMTGHEGAAVFIQAPASLSMSSVTLRNNSQAMVWEPLSRSRRSSPSENEEAAGAGAMERQQGPSIVLNRCIVEENEGYRTPGITIRASSLPLVVSITDIVLRNNKRIRKDPNDKEPNGAIALLVQGAANFEMSRSETECRIESNHCEWRKEEEDEDEDGSSVGPDEDEGNSVDACFTRTIVFDDTTNVEIRSCIIQHNKGGGISVSRADSLFLRDCDFFGNEAAYPQEGGALQFHRSVLADIKGCKFTDNIAPYRGGGLSLIGEENDGTRRATTPLTATIAETTISGNKVRFESARGAGLFVRGNVDSELYFDKVTIQHNGALDENALVYGGGAYIARAAYVEFLQSQVRENAKGNVFLGAGMFLEDVGHLIAPEITLNGNNKAETRGGGIYLGGGGSTQAYNSFLMDCNDTTSLHLNEANDGSGFYVYALLDVKIEKCSFTKNIASETGALTATSRALTILHCNFLHNTGKHGSGLNTDSHQVTINNCDFKYNQGKVGALFIQEPYTNDRNDSSSSSSSSDFSSTHSSESEDGGTVKPPKVRSTKEVREEANEAFVSKSLDIVRSLNLSELLFIENKAMVAAGLWVHSGHVDVEWSGLTFKNNEAEVAAGGAWLHWEFGTVWLDSVSFFNNQARQGVAGALAFSSDHARLRLLDSEFKDNLASVGGAMGVFPDPEELQDVYPSFIQARFTEFAHDPNFDVLEPSEEPDIIILNTPFTANRADRDSCSQDVACFLPITIHLNPPDGASPLTNKHQRCDRVESLSPRCSVVTLNLALAAEQNICSNDCRAQLGGDPTLPPLCAAVRCPSGTCADALTQCSDLSGCGPLSDSCKKEGKCFTCKSGACVRFGYECGADSGCTVLPETPVTCPDGACASHIRLCKPVPPCPISKPKRCFSRCILPAEHCTLSDIECPPNQKLCNVDGMCRTALECGAVPFQGCSRFQCPTGKCTDSAVQCNEGSTCPSGQLPCPGSDVCVPLDQVASCSRPAALRIPESFSLTVRGGEQPTTKFVITVPESGATDAGDSAFDALLSIEIPPEVLASFNEDEEFSINAKSFDDVLQYLFPGEKEDDFIGSNSDFGASDEGVDQEDINARLSKVFSSLVELSFRKVTQFNDDILLIFTVRLPKEVSLADICLAFINEEAGRWECNPDPIELYASGEEDSELGEEDSSEEAEDGFKEIMVVGKTRHFSDFAVLLNEGDNDGGEDGSGGGSDDLIVILAATLVPAAIVIICVVVLVGYIRIHKRNKAYKKQVKKRLSTKVNFGNDRDGIEMSSRSSSE